MARPLGTAKEDSMNVKMFARIPKELDEKIEKLGEGKNKSEKIRYVIEKGVETIEKAKESQD